MKSALNNKILDIYYVSKCECKSETRIISLPLSFYAAIVENFVILMQHFIYYAAVSSITQYDIVNYSLFRF